MCRNLDLSQPNVGLSCVWQCRRHQARHGGGGVMGNGDPVDCLAAVGYLVVALRCLGCEQHLAWLVLGSAAASRATFAALHGACGFGLTVFAYCCGCPNLQVQMHCPPPTLSVACCTQESTCPATAMIWKPPELTGACNLTNKTGDCVNTCVTPEDCPSIKGTPRSNPAGSERSKDTLAHLRELSDQFPLSTRH